MKTYNVEIQLKSFNYKVTADNQTEAKKQALEEYDTNDDNGNARIKEIIIIPEV